jgi:hypothetical protein
MIQPSHILFPLSSLNLLVTLVLIYDSTKPYFIPLEFIEFARYSWVPRKP